MSAHTSKMPNKKATKISSADNLLKTSKLVKRRRRIGREAARSCEWW